MIRELAVANVEVNDTYVLNKKSIRVLEKTLSFDFKIEVKNEKGKTSIKTSIYGTSLHSKIILAAKPA